MRLDQQVTDQASHGDNTTDSVTADSVISPQTSDDVSLIMSEVGAEESREQSPLVDDLNGSELY
nr:unknown [Zea mays]